MRTLINILRLFTFLALILAITQSCKKSDDDPGPVKKKSVWAVGSTDSTNYGTILFSADGGDNWFRQGEGSEALLGVNFSDVWAVDENTVWTVGNSNVILKTSDGGTNWKRITAPSQNQNVDLASISLTGSDNIWISGTNGTVYNSTDGGNNWTVIDSDALNGNFLQGIHAISSYIVYVAGQVSIQRGFAARTVDGGQLWELKYETNSWINKVSFIK